MIKLIVIMVEEEEEDDDNGDADGDYVRGVYGKRTMVTTWDTWVILRSSLCQARCCFDIFNGKKIEVCCSFQGAVLEGMAGEVHRPTVQGRILQFSKIDKILVDRFNNVYSQMKILIV